MKNLRKLELLDCVKSTLAPSIATLEYLSIDDCAFESIEPLLSLSLKTLKLKDCRFIEDLFLLQRISNLDIQIEYDLFLFYGVPAEHYITNYRGTFDFLQGKISKIWICNSQLQEAADLEGRDVVFRRIATIPNIVLDGVYLIYSDMLNLRGARKLTFWNCSLPEDIDLYLRDDFHQVKKKSYDGVVIYEYEGYTR
jgi:hypothetical protein